MDDIMNESAEHFETVPCSIEQLNEITAESIVPTVIAENVVAAETFDENGLVVQPITLSAITQEDGIGFLEASFAITAEDALAAEKLVHLSEANRVQTQLPSVYVPKLSVDVAAVVNEAAAAVIGSGRTDFDADEEQRKLLNLLQIPTPKTPVESAAIPQIDFRIVRCSNCMNAFEFEKFQFHICDYDENQQLITSPTALAAGEAAKENPKTFRMEPIFPEEHAATRLLRENQIRIRRFLKEELKYEAPTVVAKRPNSITITLDENGKKSITSDAETSFQTNVAQAAASTPNTATTANGGGGGGGAKRQETTHECSICDRRFVHASGLLRHMEKHALDLIPTTNGRQTNSLHRSHGLRVVIKCQLCGRVFFKYSAAFQHLSTHFPNQLNEMEMDNYMEVPYEAYVDEAIACIQNQQSLTNSQFGQMFQTKGCNYFKVIVLGSVLQCEFCDFIFTEVSYLFLHSCVHSPDRRFECLSCEIYVNTSKEIYSHFQAECVFMRENQKVIQANIQRYFVCNVCEKKFQTLDHLHEHRYTSFHFFPRFNPKLKKLQAPCEYCESTFDNVQDLVYHFEAQHFKKFRRDNILGGFGSNQASNKLRQYLCDVCGKSYTQSSHLWQHLRFHQGVKPFACQEPGCSRKFTIRPDLHDHIRKCHTGERPFHCHICGKRFLTGSVFYQHRLIHRGERRYECNYCSKRFYRADALKNHTRIHTGEKPYDCEYCTKSFRQRGDCDKHTRARHAHLDENTRNMLKLQKLNLKIAAAAKIGLIDEQQQQQQQQSI